MRFLRFLKGKLKPGAQKVSPQPIALAKVPEHVAIIMDGNGRWAKARGLPVAAGHRQGGEVVREIVKAAGEFGVKYLTLYAFSSENWQRNVDEVAVLMSLLEEFLVKEVQTLKSNQVRLRVIGDCTRLPQGIQELIAKREEDTQDLEGLTLIVALSYGARQEITQACQKVAAAVKRGEISLEDVTENLISSHLYTAGIPDPDLLIRTSGEVRMSNFLVWQCIYTELCFKTTFWPDYSREEFAHDLQTFSTRHRRFGQATRDE